MVANELPDTYTSCKGVRNETMPLIGRAKEVEALKKVYHSQTAEFVVLYGRRRIGKTFLIREYFAQQNCLYLQATGLQKGVLKTQLHHFADALSQAFIGGVPLKPSNSWDEAFKVLTQLIESVSRDRKIILFLDEVPWMATKKSGFLEALDYYWNRYWSAKPNIILIICGSSASWLIKNIIYNKGGLHNRCTCEIKLDPFDLSDTHAYLKFKKIKLDKRQILDIYMALGGVPYYLNYVEPGLTAAENIQAILFDDKAPLKAEFEKLFKSLFVNADRYVELIELIAKKKEGMTRAEIEELSQYSRGGGRLTQRLINLKQTNFIEVYRSLDKQRGEYYKVIDEFCLFFIYWLSAQKLKKFTEDYWLKQIEKPIFHVWAGYAFEAICHKHSHRILKALNIKTAESISSWRHKEAQIDLVIDRSDDAITLCEIKYTDKPFAIDKSYAAILQRKIDIFRQVTRTKKHIFLAIISANGVKENQYANDLVDKTLTLADLYSC